MTLELTEHEYAAAFAVLCESSRHPELIRDTVSRHVAPGLPARASLLDVGAGNGMVARALAPMFSHVTLLEPNPQQLGADPMQALPAGSRVVQGSLMESEELGQHDLENEPVPQPRSSALPGWFRFSTTPTRNGSGSSRCQGTSLGVLAFW